MTLVIPRVTLMSMSMIGKHKLSKSIFVLVFNTLTVMFPFCSVVAPGSYEKKKKYLFPTSQKHPWPAYQIQSDSLSYNILINIASNSDARSGTVLLSDPVS